MLDYDLDIPRGAVFRSRGWVLIRDGQPIRSADGITVAAKVRTFAGAEDELYALATDVVLTTLPGHYDNQPVALARLKEISHVDTAKLTFDGGVWDLSVNHEAPMVGGLVRAPWVVSR